MSSIGPTGFQHASPAPHLAPSCEPPREFRVGTYNVGAGNDGARAGLKDTAAHLADQVVNHGLDVVALQEVDVGTTRTLEDAGVSDYNETILASISAEEAGLQGDVTFHRHSLDENGNQVPYDHANPGRHPVTVIQGRDAEGRESEVRITRESYTEDGTPVDAGDGQGVITVYSADVRTPDGLAEYTIVYGSSISHQGGVYGNAVLLGPEATLQRDANGNPQLARHDLGANDPTSRGKNRTALAVGVTVDGQSATVISTHFTATGGRDGSQARDTQYDTLGRIAEDYGDNTIVLGDFNSSDKELGDSGMQGDNKPGTHWIPFAPSPIDRIYTSDDVRSSDRTHVNGGSSDHDLLTWDIDLDH